MRPADWHVRAKMTKSQQSLERQHERLEQKTREGLSDNASASARKSPGGEPWGNHHAINIRLTIPLFFGCYYLTIVAGKERRSSERLADERKKHPLVKIGNVVIFAACGIICGLAALSMFQIATAYVQLRSGAMTFGL